MWVRVSGFATLLIIFVGCTYTPSEPERPSKVPKQALWVGGADGGVFVQIRDVPESDRIYRMAIYNGRTGEVLYSGLAELRPSSASRVKVSDPGSYSGWDGEKLILSDQRTLAPVKPEHR
jgi:hypothetical protein